MTSGRLTATEMRAWRAYAETIDHLRAALEADLVPHGLSLGDYEVLVILSESVDGRLRMCDLSNELGLSPSGLTRRLDGLVKADYVARTQGTSDRRVMYASITSEGRHALQRAVPDHVRSVRTHLIDRLTPAQVTALGDIFRAVGDGLGRQSRSGT
ncbi:unannotated protein [freshwater metagenome]|uniref:Unannotated protein n=1 Tax=freshwater metagenome TaxID=449393 RepID=A0A6J7EP59_9ZZZZ|nr:MarR family transcriptional regulator [Actinomycetota bacterium]